MGQLFDLIEEHRDKLRPYAPSYSKIAEHIGVSRQTLLNWREPASLPTRRHLERLGEVTGVPYLRVLDAALADAGYLPESKRRGASDQDPGVTTDQARHPRRRKGQGPDR